MFQLADMVFQFKVGREQAFGLSGGDGEGQGQGHGHGHGQDQGQGDGHAGREDVGEDEDDGRLADEGGYQPRADNEDDEMKLALEEDELWPVLLEKDMKDL